MKFRVKIAIAFVLGVLTIGVVGIRSYLAIQRLTEANRLVVHTHQVLEGLRHVQLLVTDAETGARGFVLTGEDSFLEPYNVAISQIPKSIDSVTSLTKDNPLQQNSTQQLSKLIHEKLDVLREFINLRKQGGLNAALPVIFRHNGKRIMDEIRGLIDQMVARERLLLEVRNRAVNKLAGHGLWILAIGMLLTIVVLGVAALIVTRTIRLGDQDKRLGGTGRKGLKIAFRYAFAVPVVALAAILRGWLLQSFGPMPLFLTFYPGVLLVATIAGGGPGILTTLLAAIVTDYWFIEPIGSFSIFGTNDAVAIGIFTGTGVFLSILAERMHRARLAETISVTQAEELALLNMGNLMSLDVDHRIIRWSEGNSRLYGFNAQEANGQLTYALLQTQFPKPLKNIHHDLLEKGNWEGEVTRCRKDGTQLSLALLWVLRRDEHGEPLTILEVSTDITVRKEAENILKRDKEIFERLVQERTKELVEAQVEVERAKRLSDIGVLAATVAHELRNPLTSIGLSAYRIKKMIKDPRAEEDLNTIDKRVSEADQIINNVLSYSKIKIGAFQTVKINSILKECTDEAMGRIPGKTIVVNVKIERTEGLSIDASPLQMKEVFSNILNNAFDALNKNAGIIDIESQVNDSTVSIFIKDNGEGIDKEHLNKVFDPFFTTKTKGTGLGLAVCYRLIMLHNGSISIESDKGKGTTVTITLPIHAGATDAQENSDSR